MHDPDKNLGGGGGGESGCVVLVFYFEIHNYFLFQKKPKNQKNLVKTSCLYVFFLSRDLKRFKEKGSNFLCIYSIIICTIQNDDASGNFYV